MPRKGIDLTGKKFGRLTVIGVNGKASDGRILWKVLCECGNSKNVRTHALTEGSTVSCGCYAKTKNLIHGESRRSGVTKEYKVWADMIARCGNPNNKFYKDYGGRGIRVCERWRNSFYHFINDVGHKPSPNYQIDRIDVNGHYEPSNIRWVDPFKNAANKRPYSSNIYGLKGVTPCHGKYRARLQVRGRTVLCKIFDNLVDAANAYNEAAIDHHGEYAVLNDISRVSNINCHQ